MAQQRKKVNKDSTIRSRKKPNRRYKIMILNDRCKGCGLCVKYCTTGTIEMSEVVNNEGYFIPIVKDIKTCKGCDLCTKFCPDFAIFCIKK
jgi:2-oxoglutarate ferredoxin oxidoreductase subunit delta